MPNFIDPGELDGTQSQFASVFALHRFIALFLYPANDEIAVRARRNVHVQLGLDHLRGHEEEANATEWYRRMVEPFMSVNLADALGVQTYQKMFLDRLKKWEPVGLALRQLLPASKFHNDALRGGATLSKMFSVAAKETHKKDDTTLFKSWKEAIPVSHLLTAVVHINHARPDRTSIFPSPAELGPMLIVARRWQQFLTTEITPSDRFGNSQLPLAASELWTIADTGYPGLPLPDAPISLEPLHPDFLIRLKERKAKIAPQ